MSLDSTSLPLLAEALRILDEGFADPFPAEQIPDFEAMGTVLCELAVEMRDNYPYHHPLYAGQMLKPPHPVARLAYALSLWLNPNNHALDGGRATSRLEKESVGKLAAMFGWESHLGHLCSGGTIANLEALWVSGRLGPGRTVVASTQAHYTHERICGVLGLPFQSVDCDASGRMDLDALKRVLDEQDVGTVVATLGSTAVGAIDPLADIVELRKNRSFRIHVDAAYGGYFTLIRTLSSKARVAFDAVPSVDSIVIDPHKHGLQPYGCGCVLFQDPSVGRLYRHESPYTYFTSNDLHLGEISLECSRPGAGAAALWATLRLLPLQPGGSFAVDLEKSRNAARTLYRRLREDSRFDAPLEPELDIVVFTPRARSASVASRAAELVFEAAAEEGLHLALVTLPRAMMTRGSSAENVERASTEYWDQESVRCLRSVLMKPGHDTFMDEIWRRLDVATGNVAHAWAGAARTAP